IVKLFCAIVGVAGAAFPVDIDAGQSVGDLKEKIKAKEDIKGRARDLQLFLAKTADGAWLDGAGVAAVTVDEDGNRHNFVKMDPLLWIKND
ncbi:hypothetical protein JG688_00016947, partial [Phytophthora aleatoria]